MWSGNHPSPTLKLPLLFRLSWKFWSASTSSSRNFHTSPCPLAFCSRSAKRFRSNPTSFNFLTSAPSSNFIAPTKHNFLQCHDVLLHSAHDSMAPLDFFHLARSKSHLRTRPEQSEQSPHLYYQARTRERPVRHRLGNHINQAQTIISNSLRWIRSLPAGHLSLRAQPRVYWWSMC